MTKVDERTARSAGTAWEPRVVAFTCNWCSYSGADMAGTARLGYASNVRLVRMLCSGRLDPVFVLKAFEEGADGVLVSGCHPGDCHYVQGNLYARRRLEVFANLMDFVGIDSRRLHFAWVSASEGVKWSRVVDQVVAAVAEAGPAESWAATGAPKPQPAQPSRQAAKPPRPLPPAERGRQTEFHLRELARRLLESGEVSRVIGYAPSQSGGPTVAAFIDAPEDAELLTWNASCHGNLTTYLSGSSRMRSLARTAVVVKTCDARSLGGLLRENQLRREEVVAIGVSCDGQWSGGQMAAKCYSCESDLTPLADWSVGPDGVLEGSHPTEGRAVAPDPRDAEIAALASLTPGERLSFWTGEFDRCIRCYACRSACPMCYCETCIADKTQPQWIPVPSDGPGNFAWNITRAMHLAGRCADCDECARACPSGIRLDLLNRTVELTIERAFGSRVQADPTAATALTTYRPDDPDRFL